MSEYIKRDDLIQKLMEEMCDFPESMKREIAEKAVADMESIEVVRCKDCIHREGTEDWCCGISDWCLGPEGYCSEGEKSDAVSKVVPCKDCAVYSFCKTMNKGKDE